MASTPKTAAPQLILDVRPLIDAVRKEVPLSLAKERRLKAAFEKVVGAQLFRPMVNADPREGSREQKAGEDMVLTTQQAADLLKVSRPYLTARIDAGEIPLHQRVGNQRRVLRSEVLAWHRREQRRVAKARRALMEIISDELQTYDL